MEDGYVAIKGWCAFQDGNGTISNRTVGVLVELIYRPMEGGELET